MIVFHGDERFADLEYVGMQYDAMSRELVLLVSFDPADSCKAVVLHCVKLLKSAWRVGNPSTGLQPEIGVYAVGIVVVILIAGVLICG